MIKKLGECRNDFLSMLYGRLSELKTCEKLVFKHLPEKLVAHCKISNTRNGTITITVSNAGILSLLRYEKSELLRKLRTEEKMYALRTIDLKLAAPHFRPTKTPINNKEKLIKLSQTSFDSIQATTTHCTYSPLKKALERLEKTLKEKHFL